MAGERDKAGMGGDADMRRRNSWFKGELGQNFAFQRLIVGQDRLLESLFKNLRKRGGF
jgi:hypothetical protein